MNYTSAAGFRQTLEQRLKNEAAATQSGLVLWGSAFGRGRQASSTSRWTIRWGWEWKDVCDALRN
jgi:hypothetical protein